MAYYREQKLDTPFKEAVEKGDEWWRTLPRLAGS
jgi:hypothetical protein